MQEPIRYYITKRGEEPTVRSVKVAQSPPEAKIAWRQAQTRPTSRRRRNDPLPRWPTPWSGW